MLAWTKEPKDGLRGVLNSWMTSRTVDERTNKEPIIGGAAINADEFREFLLKEAFTADRVPPIAEACGIE